MKTGRPTRTRLAMGIGLAAALIASIGGLSSLASTPLQDDTPTPQLRHTTKPLAAPVRLTVQASPPDGQGVSAIHVEATLLRSVAACELSIQLVAPAGSSATPSVVSGDERASFGILARGDVLRLDASVDGPVGTKVVASAVVQATSGHRLGTAVSAEIGPLAPAATAPSADDGEIIRLPDGRTLIQKTIPR